MSSAEQQMPGASGIPRSGGGLPAPAVNGRASGRDGLFAIHLLGHFRIFAPDSRDVTPKSRRSRAALAYLVLAQGSAASRERLAGLLWSDRGEAQARASLRQCLHEIREALPDGATLLHVDRERIVLERAGFFTDVEQIVATLADGQPEAIEDVLDRLGTSTILADLSISALFDNWLAGERTACDDRVHLAIKQRLERAAADRAWPIVRRLADTCLARDPAAEDVVAIALRADAADIGVSTARRRFRRFEETLRAELDAAPSAWLRKVLAELEENPATSPPAAVAAPVPPPARAGADLPVVVLAPFRAALGGDSESLADLVAEEIETSLSHFDALRVVTAPDDDYQRLTDRFHGSVAGFVLLATLRQVDDELVLNARLRSFEGPVVWAMRDTLPIAGLHELAGRVVERIVGAIAPTVERSIDQRIQEVPSSPDDAVLAYCRARSLARSARSLGEARYAAEQLETVLARDRLNAGVRLHLSRLYNTDFLHNIAGHDWHELLDRAFALTRAANEIDPNNAHVQTSLGFCFLRRQRWDEAARHLERALQLSPWHADRMVEAAVGLAQLGEIERAAALVDHALQLNPFPHREYLTDWAMLKMLARQHAAAEQSFEASTDEALHYVAIRLANLGYLDDAARRAAVAARLRERFRLIWQGAEPAQDRDILAWLERHLRFRREEERSLVREGLRRAGLTID